MAKKAHSLRQIENKIASKLTKIRKPTYPIIEYAPDTFLRCHISPLRGQSVFWEYVIRKCALDNFIKIILEAYMEGIKKHTLLVRFNHFKSSFHWFQNFMTRNTFSSMKPRGELGCLDQQDITRLQERFQKRTCMWNIAYISNKDEVGVWYRSFQIRTVFTSYAPKAYKLIKDRLTAVLTVFSNSKKAPFVINGKPMRPKTFPRLFDPLKALRLFYYTQKTFLE